ncbi:MAG: hypothetical protein WC525_05275, partial [Candidatus Thermoplasmatota archaeon]
MSSTLVVANTNQNQPTLSTNDIVATSQGNRAVVWDNAMGYTSGSLAAQYYPGDLDAFPADDFELDKTYSIDTVEFQAGYYNCQYAQGTIDYGYIWNITFYSDNGSIKPGDVIEEYSFDNASLPHTYWYTGTNRIYFNYTATLDPPLLFHANTKYWIGIYGYNLTFPQMGWVRHNESNGGIKLHMGVFKSAYFSFPDWINTDNASLLGAPNDFNFALGGTEVAAPALEITSIAGPIGVTATIKNTGDAPATTVDWDIAFTGGFILLGGAKSGSIPQIGVGEAADAKIPFVIGFGKSVIGVNVTCAEGATASKTQNATVLLIFVLTK